MNEHGLTRILLPIDVTQCPLEVFDLANRFAKRPGATLILLHVVNLNIVAPENRVYGEVAREAHGHLERLADEYLDPGASTLIRVRTGKPAEEIVAEAADEKVDLILLPTYGPSLWTRLASVWNRASVPIVDATAEQVIREAACGVFVVSAKSRFNCRRAWGRPRALGAEEGTLAAGIREGASWPAMAGRSRAGI